MVQNRMMSGGCSCSNMTNWIQQLDDRGDRPSFTDNLQPVGDMAHGDNIGAATNSQFIADGGHQNRRLKLSRRLSNSLDSILSTMGVEIKMKVTTRTVTKKNAGAGPYLETGGMLQNGSSLSHRTVSSNSSSSARRSHLSSTASSSTSTTSATSNNDLGPHSAQQCGSRSSVVSSSKRYRGLTTRTTNNSVSCSSHHISSSVSSSSNSNSSSTSSCGGGAVGGGGGLQDRVIKLSSGFSADDDGIPAAFNRGNSSVVKNQRGQFRSTAELTSSSVSGAASNMQSLRGGASVAENSSTLTLHPRVADPGTDITASAHDLVNKFEHLHRGLVSDNDFGTRAGGSAFTAHKTSRINGSGCSDSDGSDDDRYRESKLKLFEQKQSYSSSQTTAIRDGCIKENASAREEQVTQIVEGDNAYQENRSRSDNRSKLNIDGVLAEKGFQTVKEERHVREGGLTRDETARAALAEASVTHQGFRAEKMAMLGHQHVQTAASGRVLNKQERQDSAYQMKFTINQHTTHVETPPSPAVASAIEVLGSIDKSTNALDVNQAMQQCSYQIASLLKSLDKTENDDEQSSKLEQVDFVMQRVWSLPQNGPQLAMSLGNTVRQQGCLDSLINSCDVGNDDQPVPKHSMRVLSRFMTPENRQYLVERDLVGSLVRTASRTCRTGIDKEDWRAGADVLERMFKHSEGTCSDVVRYGGLDAVLHRCQYDDIQTLRHCAVALVNLSLYGGPENHATMVERKVPSWLFRLACHADDCVRYYGCLAIVTMLANKEIEAAIQRSETLELVAPLVTKNDPDEFARKVLASEEGHTSNWLKHLVPVLLSVREEVRNLVAFHFCMEAGIKVRLGRAEIFEQIGAVEPLRQVAGSPNDIAAKYAAKTLRRLGIEVPRKLSQQVPLWDVGDVVKWVKQIDFGDFEQQFVSSRVDGDLLLRLDETMLRDDIGISNGILRSRFIRELNHLKRIAEYSCCDTSQLHEFLNGLGPEYTLYTYRMLSSGVDRHFLRYLTDEQLERECGVENSIHRLKLHEAIKQENRTASPPIDVEKTLDCFISYRRSNGAQLASLLKVLLELRGFSVFIDVERLEAGKFGNNLLNSIYQASNFIMVLTPNALDRCIDDAECKDWVRKEIHAALSTQCNIIPILDSFEWPEPGQLPEDIRPLCNFNGIRWIHDYQDACVGKLERFMRGMVNRAENRLARGGAHMYNGSSASVSRCHSPSQRISVSPLSRLHLTPIAGIINNNYNRSSNNHNDDDEDTWSERTPVHRPLVMTRSRSLDDTIPTISLRSSSLAIVAANNNNNNRSSLLVGASDCGAPNENTVAKQRVDSARLRVPQRHQRVQHQQRPQRHWSPRTAATAPALGRCGGRCSDEHTLTDSCSSSLEHLSTQQRL